MGRKKSNDVAQRAWNLLRLALLWARKGGVFKRRLMMELRLFPKFLKGLAPRNNEQIMMNSRHYKERQLSFNETPLFHLKMNRPTSMRFLLPCISMTGEHRDFDEYDLGVDGYDNGRKSYEGSEIEEEEGGAVEECGYEGCDEKDEGIDLKAEKFIEKFYEQMRLQRQISYLEYTERINRDSSC